MVGLLLIIVCMSLMVVLMVGLLVNVCGLVVGRKVGAWNVHQAFLISNYMGMGNFHAALCWYGLLLYKEEVSESFFNL